jgi:hypothetical protein
MSLENTPLSIQTTNHYELCVQSQQLTTMLVETLNIRAQGLQSATSNPMDTYTVANQMIQICHELINVSNAYMIHSRQFMESVVNATSFESISSPTSVMVTEFDLDYGALQAIARERLELAIDRVPIPPIQNEDAPPLDSDTEYDNMSTDDTMSVETDESYEFFRHLQTHKVRPHLKYTCITMAANKKERDCPICFESYCQSSLLKFNCNHVFCSVCCLDHLRSSVTNKQNDQTYNCPCCRGAIECIELQYCRRKGVTIYDIKESELSLDLQIFTS